MGVVDYRDDIVLKIEFEGKIYTTLNSIYHKAHSNIPIQDVQKLAEVIHNKLRKTAIPNSDLPIILDALILFCYHSGKTFVKALGETKDKIDLVYTNLEKYLNKNIVPIEKLESLKNILNTIKIHQGFNKWLRNLRYLSL